MTRVPAAQAPPAGAALRDSPAVAAALARIKPEVRAQQAYTLTAPAAARKLNQNESPFDAPDAVKDAVLAAARTAPWNRYPPYSPAELLERIARRPGWTPDGVLVAVYGGRHVGVPLTSAFEFDITAVIRAARDTRAPVVVVNSPNNPTGTPLPEGAAERLLAETEALVVLDEAYQDFGGPTAIPLLGRAPRLVGLGPFSQAVSPAGRGSPASSGATCRGAARGSRTASASRRAPRRTWTRWRRRSGRSWDDPYGRSEPQDARDRGTRAPEPRRLGSGARRDRHRLLRPHAGGVGAARSLRPGRARRGRPAGGRPSHRGRRGDRARPGAVPGAGRAAGGPPLPGGRPAARRGPGPRGRGRERPPVPRLPRGASHLAEARGLRRGADARGLPRARDARRPDPARRSAAGAERAPRRGGRVQGGGAGARSGERARPPGDGRAVDEGLAVDDRGRGLRCLQRAQRVARAAGGACRRNGDGGSGDGASRPTRRRAGRRQLRSRDAAAPGGRARGRRA